MSKAINIALGIGIAIILVLVVTLGIKTFYPTPEYSDFCGSDLFSIENQANCITAGGEWEQGQLENSIERCNPPKDCSNKYQNASNVYGRNVFFIANLIGLLLIIISLFLMSMMNISAGIAFSGIALFVYGFSAGWQGTADVWKFSVGVIIAILLIIVAVVVNKKFQEK